jgi:hypothetical protein
VQKIQVLGFVNDFDILGCSLNDIKRAAQVLEQAAGKLGQQINREKRR